MAIDGWTKLMFVLQYLKTNMGGIRLTCLYLNTNPELFSDYPLVISSTTSFCTERSTANEVNSVLASF